MPNQLLQVIIASTRPGRSGPAVAGWITRCAQDHAGFDVEVVDLAEVDLPMLNEPNHPRLQQYVHTHTKDWSRTVARADAYVFVHPEYNHGMNGALKNAIDYLFIEWQHKPVSFISYGGVSGGLRAVQMLKQVVTALKMVPVQEAVTIPFIAQHINDGCFIPSPAHEASAKAMLDELALLGNALRPLRKNASSDT
ncbi:NADPH-dependent FMN reductase [Arthrobacter sp. GCM10027362]|uniref:NADPH-dependent FMN reductase n=1 Tax=Arthrobacter sp. GCM10027362 TaxID=3273379 RepID=UPI0036424C62